MTINATDIKLLESEVMADTTDGGGRRTSRVIPDGVAGNIFPKVSRLDSVYGRVNLRKVFGAVQTANTDTYAGAHAIITDAPDNAKIHTTLFSTASEYDIRTAARDRIESYVTSGPESRMVLLGRQLPGQQTFNAYQRVEDTLPEVGTVYCLSNESGSVTTAQQYVRVQDVTHEVRTFEDSNGTFQRRVITVDVGVPLRYEFNGPDTASRYSNVARASRIRDTTVVDAARYFGIQKLAVGASANDLEVQVESVYTAIVPTTNRETPISNENISDSLNLVSSNAATISATLSAFSIGATRYTRRSITPGTLTLSGAGVTTLTDDKKGVISNSTFVGTVDYETGAITRTGGTASAIDVTATYRPAAPASQTAHTLDSPITLANRGTVYALTLNPLPQPGTIIIDYRALGKWYRLRDNGAGSVSGTDAAYGVGNITYNTGALVITLGALPDVDSSVIVTWGSPVHYTARAGASSDAATTISQTFTLPDLPVNPDSFSLSYTSGGVTYTATDNANGVLSGGGVTGTVNYTTGIVDIEYTIRLPDANTTVDCAYQQIVPTTSGQQTVKSTTLTSAASMSLGDSIVAGTVVGSVHFSGDAYKLDFAGNLIVSDTGSGLLAVRAGQVIDTSVAGSAVVTADTNIGTINYATGDIVINQNVPVGVSVFNPIAINWEFDTSQFVSVSAGVANFGWKSSGVASSNTAKTASISFASAPLVLDLTRTIGDHIMPSSVMFTAGGKTYIDRNGSLYTDVSTTTGAGVYAGTMDYSTGKASISTWANGAALGVSVSAALTSYGEHSIYDVVFRTPGSPIRPGSLYLQASTTSGELLSGTANDSGIIAAGKISANINHETGVVHAKFGQWVTAAGNEAQWWYRPENVVGGLIFEPEPIQPSTLAYNCVVLANLPLNADILGLDPVRLPMDGRVPVYRPADVVVIHHTGSTTLANPVVAGSTYSVGRTNLSELWLVDQNGVKLTSGQYAYDLPAGAVTIAADFTAGALVQPIIAKHRVEDMNLLSDVQINGQLTLASPLSRDYTADSYVSSALLFGDMMARITNVHDLLAFSAWTDVPGTGSNAQYNNIDYPIEAKNNGGLNERWRINFTSTTTFQVIGENLGVIATGATNADCSPANALTGQPYFTIRAAGWGSGWSAGNQLRFNSISAAAPIWIARTVLPGATLEGDSFSMQMRGDVDAI